MAVGIAGGNAVVSGEYQIVRDQRSAAGHLADNPNDGIIRCFFYAEQLDRGQQPQGTAFTVARCRDRMDWTLRRFNAGHRKEG
jgi:hypothetical protein